MKYKGKKIRRDLLVFLYIVAFIFLIVDVLTINKPASGVVGDVTLTQAEQNIVGVAPGTGGSLPTGTPQYYVVAAFNGSPTPTPLVKSAVTKCTIGTGQNSCTLTWPCVAGASTYRVYTGTTTGAVGDGQTTAYASVNSPTTTYAHTAATGQNATVPSGSLPLSNYTGSGDLWTLACRMGLGTSSPTGTVEINGNVRMDGTGTILNSAVPIANSDLASKTYVDSVCP